jgi:hypothetical protein
MQAFAKARNFPKFTLVLCLAAFAVNAPLVRANPVGDFFKRVGRSMSHLRRSPTPTPTPRPSKEEGRSEEAPAKKEEPKRIAPFARFVAPAPTPMEIRPAASAPADRRRPRDLPYGIAVPNRPGLVTSPYAPSQGFVDVRAFPSSTEVMDPFTGKVFLTP